MSAHEVSQMGPYSLIKKLGQGDMAEVFAAIHRGAAGFERPVCVKRVIQSYAWDEEFQKLFVREAKLAGQLIHSNIVQVFDCFGKERELGLVMELIDGIDLSTLRGRLHSSGEKIPHGPIAYIAGQILLGLSYAHKRNIIHCDICPNNIIISRYGEVKIVDFGMGQAMSTLATINNTFLSKFAYMSPEQAMGHSADHLTDLYSVGLVLYELIFGRPYFDVDSVGEALNAISQAQQPKISQVQPEFAALIERLLHPLRSERFQSAEEALCALPPWEVCGPMGARFLNEIVRRFSRSIIEDL